MGLVKEGEKFVVLSDILGEEDHLGDMDFKVAGTEDGITALQMDIKIEGVSAEILTKALGQAREGRLHILGIMNQTIAQPRSDISDFAPKVISLKVPTEKIGLIIGPGGKNIKGMSEKSGSTINIDDDGTVTIYNHLKEGRREGPEDGRGADRGGGGRQDLRRPREADHGVRRVRRDPPRQGRPRAHLQARRPSGWRRSRTWSTRERSSTVIVTEIDHMGRVNLATKAALEANPGLLTEHAERRPPRRDGPDRGPRGPRRDGDRPHGSYRDDRPRRDGPDRGPRPPRRDG